MYQGNLDLRDFATQNSGGWDGYDVWRTEEAMTLYMCLPEWYDQFFGISSAITHCQVYGI